MSKPKTPEPSKAPETEGTIRLVVELPVSVHRGLKAKAASEGKTLKEYVLELLKEQGF